MATYDPRRAAAQQQLYGIRRLAPGVSTYNPRQVMLPPSRSVTTDPLASLGAAFAKPGTKPAPKKDSGGGGGSGPFGMFGLLGHFINPIELLGKPLSAVTSGLKEITDLGTSILPDTKLLNAAAKAPFPALVRAVTDFAKTGDPKVGAKTLTTKTTGDGASFGDFWDQFNEGYNYGRLIKETGQSTGTEWGDRITGLVGDIALDPLTYVMPTGKAATQFAGRTGREALALRAVEAADAAGLDTVAKEALVSKAGRFGPGALNAAERQLLGLPQSGATVFGQRIAGTGKFAERLGEGLSATRAKLGDVVPIFRSDKMLTRGFQPFQRRLMTGEGTLSATQAAAVIGKSRQAKGVAGKLVAELDPEAAAVMKALGGRRADWARIRTLVETGSDAPEAVAWRQFSDHYFNKVNEALVGLGEQPIKYMNGWAPRKWTLEGKAWLNGDTPLAQALRRGAGVSGRQGDIEFERVLRAGVEIEVNGQRVVLDGTTSQLNALARTEGVKRAISDNLPETLQHALNQAKRTIEGGKFRSGLRDIGVADSKYLADDVARSVDDVIDPETGRRLNTNLMDDVVDVKATRAAKAAAVAERKGNIDTFQQVARDARVERRGAMGDVTFTVSEIKRQVNQKLTDRLNNAGIARTAAGKKVAAAAKAWEADDAEFARLLESLDKQIAAARKVAKGKTPAAEKAKVAEQALTDTRDEVEKALDEIASLSSPAAPEPAAVMNGDIPPSVASDVPPTAVDDVVDTGVDMSPYEGRISQAEQEVARLEAERASMQAEIDAIEGRSAAPVAGDQSPMARYYAEQKRLNTGAAPENVPNEVRSLEEMNQVINDSNRTVVEYVRPEKVDKRAVGRVVRPLKREAEARPNLYAPFSPKGHGGPWWTNSYFAVKDGAQPQGVKLVFTESTESSLEKTMKSLLDQASQASGPELRPMFIMTDASAGSLNNELLMLMTPDGTYMAVNPKYFSVFEHGNYTFRMLAADQPTKSISVFNGDELVGLIMPVRSPQAEWLPRFNPGGEAFQVVDNAAEAVAKPTAAEMARSSFLSQQITKLDEQIAAQKDELSKALVERDVASIQTPRPPDPFSPAPVVDPKPLPRMFNEAEQAAPPVPAAVAPVEPTPIEDVVREVARTPRQQQADDMVADLTSDRMDSAVAWDQSSARQKANVEALKVKQAEAEQTLEQVAEVVGRSKDELRKLARTQNVSVQQITNNVAEMAGLLSDNEIGRSMQALTDDLITQAQRVERLDYKIGSAEKIVEALRSSDPVYATVLQKAWKDGWEELAKTGTMLPTEVAEALRYVDMLSQPKVAGKFLRVVDAYTTFFKSWALATPGFHLRNSISATGMNFVAGVELDDMIRGTKYWRMYMRDHVNWWKQLSDPEEQRVAQAALEAVFGSGAGQYDELSYVWTSRLGPPWGRASQKLGRNIEGSVRMGMALDTMRIPGATVDGAIARINRYHFNYGETSAFDEGMKRIIPFWTFTSRNLPLQVQEMWLRPRVYVTYDKFVNNMRQDQEGDIIPIGLSDMGAFIAQRGDGPDGEGSWMLAPDLAWSRLEQELGKFTDPKRFLSNASPLIRVPLETMVTNSRLYNDVPFKENGLVEDTWTQRLLGPVLDAVGLQQTAGDGSKVVDERLPYAVESLFPLFGQGERLIPTQDYFQQRKFQSLLNWLGLPAKQLTRGAIDSEVRRREYEARSRQARMDALANYGK